MKELMTTKRMMETASSYWNDFPTKLFGCCQAEREESHQIEPEPNINSLFNNVKSTDLDVI
jgi:hypothetical protein